jgi:hypothetical protein
VITQTLRTMRDIRHHVPSGTYFNWYDEATGEVRTTDPDGTHAITPFVSSVNNGWFAAGPEPPPALPSGPWRGHR